jgi:DNA-binding CsgD family transcriptional regulator
VSRHCARFSSPIVWDRRTYAGNDTEALWERQEPFGYRSGIAVAMHLGRGKHFMFGANWNRDLCKSVPNFKSIGEDLLSFSEHAQAAAFELCQPARLDLDNPRSLAARELETLRWSMDGLTAWEVADRMSISERHATLLTRRAMEKLGCSSKYEASLRAIRLGLIGCN